MGPGSPSAIHEREMGTVKHAPYHWLPLAEGRLTRRLFGAVVRRMEALPVGRRGGEANRSKREGQDGENGFGRGCWV